MPRCVLRAVPCRARRYEFAGGKNLLSGEYVLPSGTALPFGAMISKLKRDRLVGDLVRVRRLTVGSYLWWFCIPLGS